MDAVYPSQLSLNPALSPEACEVWDQVVAPKYARFERILVDAARALSLQVRAELPNVRLAVDVGCGFGDTCVELAEHCEQVIGIDCSELLCQIAKQRYGAVNNLTFENQDVGNYAPPRKADLVYSRFGLMFFERPVQALRHIRSWMREGAALRTLVWSQRADNPWLELGKSAVLDILPPVDAEAPNCGPGPFSLSDPETTEGILHAAGFRDVRMRLLKARVNLGTPTDAAHFQFAMGPVGEIVRHAQERNASGVSAAFGAVRDALSRHTAGTEVTLECAAWWVEATA